MDTVPEGRTVRGAGRAPARRELRHRLGRADLRQVAEARGLLRERLSGWGVAALSDTAELLVSELVTNALVHTGRGAVLTARLTPSPAGRLRVEVRDFAVRRPRARVAGEQEQGGRGLVIVRALADAWGVASRPVGKTVWFELSAAGTP
jgi:anti-sigma regulatory factor (Ser/Thr protein kinase)